MGLLNSQISILVSHFINPILRFFITTFSDFQVCLTYLFTPDCLEAL